MCTCVIVLRVWMCTVSVFFKPNRDMIVLSTVNPFRKEIFLSHTDHSLSRKGGRYSYSPLHKTSMYKGFASDQMVLKLYVYCRDGAYP